MKESPRENSNYLKPYTLKPTPIPDGFVLVIDTRENRNLFSKPPKGLLTVRDKLQFGDYSIRGMTDIFAVERKFSGDLYPYCSTEREKTVRKMEEFRNIIKNGGWVGLVIEEKESSVYSHQEFTKVHPECVRGAINSFEIRYGVHCYFSGNRENAARWILDKATKFWLVKHEL